MSRRFGLVTLMLILAFGGARLGSSGVTRRDAVCPTRAMALQGVYHPDRLNVLVVCKKAAGVVASVRHESGNGGDGDLHIQLTLDPKYLSLKNAANDKKQDKNLVVEFMPRDGGHLPRPDKGQHLVLVGAWVLDMQHGWRELHPVWSVRVDDHTYRSGPLNGGSPAGDRSRNSEADCIDHGQPCVGYP